MQDEATLDLASLIHQARKRAGLTQDALARAVRVGTGNVALWERGLEIPSAVHRRRLARVLEAPELTTAGLRRGSDSDTAAILDAIYRVESKIGALQEIVARLVDRP